MPDFGFPKSRRLLRSADFDRVFQQRCSKADRNIVVYACRASGEETRLGLVVSRKCGNAVVRNRWKRALREAFRLSRPGLPQGLDLVVIPRPRATPEVASLRASLETLCQKLQRRLQASAQADRPQSPGEECDP